MHDQGFDMALRSCDKRWIRKPSCGQLYEDTVGNVTDGLTGVYSHGIFQAFLTEECNRCNRYGEVFSLALIDVDFLGKLNTQKGPLEGDQH